jgi:Na+/melibiose symporter-like transporter
MMPPELFASRGVVVGLAAQMLFWSGQASFFLVLSLYLQLGRGMSALHSGLVFTILAGAYLLTSLRAPALTVRHGRRVLAAGAGMLVVGHLTLALTLAPTWWESRERSARSAHIRPRPRPSMSPRN